MTVKITTLAGTFGLALLLLGLGTAAHADVTNPADNPDKITVKGDDGQTYVDGQDTLPGYDDEECTYIPGAWFDFDKNRVYYADGQWIPWTEWDRATGYKDWLAKKTAGTGGSGGTTTGTKTTGTKTTGTKTTGTKTTGTKTTGTKTTGTKTTGTKTTGTKTSTTTTATGTTKTTDADPSVTPSPAATQQGTSTAPSATAGAVPSASPGGATPGPSTSPAAVVAAGPEAGASAGPGAGIAILGGLAVVGGLAYGVNWFVRRRPERGLA